MARKPRKILARRRTDAEKDAASWSAPTNEQASGNGWNQVKFWLADSSDECAGRVWQWVERLRQRWAIDGITDLIHEAIYADEPLGLGFDGQAGVYGYGGMRFPRQAPANLNFVMAFVDTATSRLCKRRPMPIISCDDAPFSQKQFAKSVSRVLRRKMGSHHVEAQNPLVIRDALTRGTGLWGVHRQGGDVGISRVPSYELVFDPREAYYEEVRTIVRVHPVARETLMRKYPHMADEIAAAPPFTRADPWMMYVYQGPTFADHVEVARAVHLPSEPGADDGQEVICLRGVVLKRKRWCRPRFPWVRMFWNPPFRGFRGRGLVQQLAGIQCKVNDILRDAQEALYHGSQLKVFVQRGSNIIKNHLRAKHPAVIEYDGAEPHYVAQDPASEQSLRIMEMLIDKAAYLSGLSDTAIAAKAPLGPNASGKAIETMDDLQSDRHASVELGYGFSRVELGRVVCDEAREIYEEVEDGVDAEDDWPNPEAVDKGDVPDWITENKWDTIDIDSGEYTLTLEPVNFLPESRSGKLATVNEMAKNGFFPDPTLALSAFDEPDITRMNRSILGPANNIDRMLEDLANTAVPLVDCLPSIYTNLALFALEAKGVMEQAAAERAGDAVLERFDQAIKYAKSLNDQMNASASLPGMQSTQMGPAPNAGNLPPGAMPGAAPPMAPGGMPPGAVPPGMPQ